MSCDGCASGALIPSARTLARQKGPPVNFLIENLVTQTTRGFAPKMCIKYVYGNDDDDDNGIHRSRFSII